MNTNELFGKQFYANPVSITYNRTISAPKYKSGTDIFFGTIGNTPDSLVTNNDYATLSTSFQTKFTNFHNNFLFEDMLDKSKISYVLSWYTKNNPAQGYDEQTRFQHTWTYSYIKTFKDIRINFFKKVLDKEKWKDNNNFFINREIIWYFMSLFFIFTIPVYIIIYYIIRFQIFRY